MITNAQDLGIDLGDDVFKQTDKLEKDIIRKEISPVVKERIEPALNQVQRELVIVVDYAPGNPLKIKLSRRVKLESISDLLALAPDPRATHSTHVTAKQTVTRANVSKLIVHLPDGKVIQEDTVAATLVEAIIRADPMRVRPLSIICCHVPLVSTNKDCKYCDRQVDVGNGLYVIKHSNNKMRIGFLEKISKSLMRDWKVVLF